ncbi:hypothetical protein LCGC14_1480810 [marine sediment metagenome]|uniref:Uncharacterized protein n=1 Tax=marine sediment metagenome TaxID=412755 RepID=A0A0F9LQ47_9ZZZZ
MRIPEIKLIERNGYVFQVDMNNPNRRHIAGLIIALGATGLGLQVKGQIEAGKAAEAKSKSEAAWQEYNAKLAEREAEEVQTAASEEEKDQRKAAARLKARRRTQAGQTGIEPIGSFVKVQEETATELEIDALRIRRGGQVGARTYWRSNTEPLEGQKRYTQRPRNEASGAYASNRYWFKRRRGTDSIGE